MSKIMKKRSSNAWLAEMAILKLFFFADTTKLLQFQPFRHSLSVLE